MNENPTVKGTYRPLLQRRDYLNAGVAQSVEHVLGKDGVTGSIPVSSLIRTYTYSYCRIRKFSAH